MFLLADEAVPVTFEELMIFIIGTDTIPVLGFSKMIEVMFSNQEPRLCRLPNTSTCALQIWLPRETNALSDIMVLALKESHGFYKNSTFCDSCEEQLGMSYFPLKSICHIEKTTHLSFSLCWNTSNLLIS
jgi:hypothetical protein